MLGRTLHQIEGIPGGKVKITKALDAAEVAVVVWTEGAVQSAWVYAEAVRAAAQRKVVTVREASLDPARIPMPFNVFHADAVDAQGRGHRELLDAIEKRTQGEPSQLPNDLTSGYRNFLVDPKQEGLPPWAAAKRPAALLLAKHRLVDYDDIHGIVDEMVAWAVGQPAHAIGSPVLGRLVHGPGGLGKTRAMIEVAEVLAKEYGWLAGFVPRGVREEARAAMEALIARGDAPGLLLVLDYAEGRQDDVKWLAERMAKRALLVKQKPARLVLLSRGAGDWWKDLLLTSQDLQDLTSMGDDRYDVREIPTRIARGDRLAMFDRASASFLAFRRRQQPDVPTPPPPSDALAAQIDRDTDYDRPLAVQMAGLLHALGYDAGENRSGMAGLIEKVLGLEYEHWDKALTLDARSNWPQAVRNGVAQLSLVGGVDTKDAAERLLTGDLLFAKDHKLDVPGARKLLHSLFPAGSESLAQLEPDLLGEHHVADTADDALIDACLDWAADNNDARQTILTVLNRATRAEHGAAADKATRQLARLISRRGDALASDIVGVAASTPGKLLQMAPDLEAHVPSLDQVELGRLADALPQQSLALMDLALAVRQRQAEMAREQVAALTSRHLDEGTSDEATIKPRAQLSSSLNNLAVRLSDLGRREEALAATAEAVDTYRALAEARPDAFRPDLAASLNNLGNWLSGLGRREEALAATAEAVDIRRSLAEARPDAFRPDLAASLNNLGNWLSGLGRREEALAATAEAVDTYRALAEARPDAFRPDLAASLNNLGAMLSDLGRREEALAATAEAVDTYRALAEARPDAFRPDLAMSLNNLGNWLSGLGRREEALAATAEAVDTYRALAEARPDAFRPDLATSLNSLAYHLLRMYRGADALVASREASAIRRSLADTARPELLVDLANSLDTTADVLVALGHTEDADAMSREALSILVPFLEHDENAQRIATELRKKLLPPAAN